MTTTIAEYSKTEAALSDLRTRYSDVVFNVTTGKGMDEAKKARAELRDYRVSLEKERVTIKAPALERCRQIDSEAKRITAELSALEDPIDATIKAEEQRKANEKAERERIERERVEAVNRRFQDMRAIPLGAMNCDADGIRALIDSSEAIDIESFPDDMRAAAQYEKRIVVTALRAALDARLQADEEAAKIAADRAELDRLRAEQEALRAEADRLAQAERDRVAAAERAAEEAARAEREAAELAERAERDADEAKQRAEREEADRIKRADLDRQQAEMAAERARLAKEKEAAAKAARDAEIANASLLSAAADAVTLLTREGYGDHLVTQKLAAAVKREPAQELAA